MTPSQINKRKLNSYLHRFIKINKQKLIGVEFSFGMEKPYTGTIILEYKAPIVQHLKKKLRYCDIRGEL